MQTERPGISFEKAVALVQAQFDPAANVTHNEVIVDRLGHSRQFDVVIRGAFAGQAQSPRYCGRTAGLSGNCSKEKYNV